MIVALAGQQHISALNEHITTIVQEIGLFGFNILMKAECLMAAIPLVGRHTLYQK